jgi:outer membrane autotransporter protein
MKDRPQVCIRNFIEGIAMHKIWTTIGRRKSRQARTFHITPVTRAVRIALAASAAALALTNSGAAFAQTCTRATNAAIVCSDAWVAPAEGDRVHDLTLVAGLVPKTVVPADSAYVQAIDGIQALGGSSVTIVNTNPIEASSDGDVFGIYADLAEADLTVVNRAPIAATSSAGSADGIFANARTLKITNADDITATGYAWAAGIEAYGSESVTVVNTADGIINAATTVIDGQAPNYAYGIFAVAVDGDVTVRNAGDIGARAPDVYPGFLYTGGATGIAAIAYDDVVIRNSGTVSASAGIGSIGIWAIGGGEDSLVDITSTGSIEVERRGSPYADVSEAFGVLASGNEIVIRNRGDIAIYGGAADAAAGIAGVAANDGFIDNRGSVAMVGSAKYTYGMQLLVTHGDAVVDNSGIVDISYGNYNFGIQAVSQYGEAAVYNTGTIEFEKYGNSTGTGIAAYGGAGVVVHNEGTIRGGAESQAYGIVARSGDGDVEVVNTGLIDLGVFATEGSRYAYGVQAYADEGDVSIRNTETGVIGAFSKNNNAIGITGATSSGAVDIENAGRVYAIREAYSGTVIGVAAYSTDGDIAIANSGEVRAGIGYNMYVYGGQTTGVLAETVNGDITVGNSGLISVTGYSPTSGLLATTAGDIEIVNSGEIVVDDGYYSLGVLASGNEVAIANSGHIDAATSYGVSIGIGATGGDTLVVRNAVNGNIAAHSGGAYTYAAAVIAQSNGEVLVDNRGAITASKFGELAGGFFSVGVGISADGGTSARVSNRGDVAVYARADGADRHYQHARGIIAGSSGDVEVALHEGSTVLLDSAPYAYGVSAVSGGGTVTVDNTGAVTVVDDFDAQSDVYSMDGFAVGITGGAADALRITNRGDVVIDTTMGSAVGINASGSSVDVRNLGSIDVDARGISGFLTLAIITGVGAGSYGDINVVNDGDLAVRSSSGVANGILATSFGDGNISLRNEGSLVAYGGGDNGYQTETAWGISASARSDGDIDIVNTGSIAVDASHTAFGISARGYGDGEVSIHNAGEIEAHSNLALAREYAVTGITASGANVTIVNADTGRIHAFSYGANVGIDTRGDVLTVVNDGEINATTDIDQRYYAIGVRMDATISATFDNTGTITTTTANGVGTGVAVLIESDGALNFSNTGTLEGAVITRSGDDAITGRAGSTWTLAHRTTDLGAGDDRIRNLAGATLDLDSGRIVLGEGRNGFANEGRIRVRGDSLVDMGRDMDAKVRFGPALVNDGMIDLGSAATDRLTVAGDLGGHGVIHLGRDGGAGGQLLVHGSVRRDARQIVDLNFAGLQALRRGDRTPFATVIGDSSEASFVAGQVHGFEPGNFLKLEVDINSRIDAGNTRSDVFSAGVKAQGLDDSGQLAASVGSGVQALLASQIGTWRQRAGVVPTPIRDRTVTGFVRSFGDKAGMRPGAIDSVGGLSQRNAGTELGMNVQPFAGFRLGMVLGQSDGQQALTGAGQGLSWTQAKTYGLYGTWIAPRGLYLDTSLWQMDFASRLDAPGSRQHVRGKAGAVNLEAGYRFVLAHGLRLEPQLQYTLTQVEGLSLQGSQAQFRSDEATWSRARLGLLAWKPIRGRSGIVWTPHASASLVRMDTGTGYVVSDVFSGATSMEGTSTLLELGLGAYKGRLSWNGGLNWIDGAAYEDSLGGQLSLQYAW